MTTRPDIQGARAAAMRWIQHYSINRAERINLDDIAFDKGIIVQRADVEGAEARLLRKGDWAIITVRNDTPESGRVRFSIAHELGHWERHSRGPGAWMCTSDNIHAYSGGDIEIEANAFASELLMPTQLMTPYRDAEVSVELVREVSGVFRTSLTASAVRVVEQSTQDAYVVFSRNGSVIWSRRSASGSRFWIQPGQSLSCESVAWGCVKLPDDADLHEQVPPEAWFLSDAGVQGYSVWEQSVLLGDYGVVLTLLSVA